MSSIGRHEEEFARSLARIGANDPTFTEVIFHGWGIGDEGANRLITALETNTVLSWLNLTLKTLDLSNNGLSAALVTALLEMLKNRTTSLEVLQLGDKDFGDLGAVAVTRFLRNNSSVKYLFLENCGIGVEGARALAGALPSNLTLTHLWLGGNSLGDEGASLLAGALPGHLSLLYLGLNENEVGDVGAMALTEALPHNSSLTELDLRRNSIGDLVARPLAKALLVNSSFTRIFLDDNNSRAPRRLAEELGEINAYASNPQEALGRKVSWLHSLDEGRLRLLGFEASEVEEEVRRLETVCRVGWLIDSGVDGEKEEAATLVLNELEHFVQADQRRGLFKQLLCSPQHGNDVAKSLDVTTARTLYQHAAECGAAPGVLMNLLRAHKPLCTYKDAQHGFYPFMLLATMTESGVEDVMELLQMNPNLVEDGICNIRADKKRKRQSSTG